MDGEAGEDAEVGQALAPGAYTYEVSVFGWLVDVELDVADEEIYRLCLSVEAPAEE